MKKVLLSSAAALILSGAAFAESKTVAEVLESGKNVRTNYISPKNTDGVQDSLRVPIQIKDKRYVVSWTFIIENEKGETIRTIGYKEKRDGKLTLKEFFKSLITPKKSVDIPKEIVWNGVMDNGEFAPDGTYQYYLTATDNNDNKKTSSKNIVVVDNTPPEINLAQPSQGDKIFGEGAKTVFSVNQSGSKEDSWTGTFTNAKGEVVFKKSWTDSEPLKFDWNGTDNDGLPVADGVYKYEVSATDKAGNKSAPATIANIIYSAEKPATNIVLSGGKYFSPKGNGDIKTISFDVKIPVPDPKSGNKLVKWSVEIFDDKGTVYRRFDGTDNPPSTITWDGKDDSGNEVTEGNAYQATVNAKYLNGYETAPVNSPLFTLDNTPPKIELQASSKVFSPDGDGNLDNMEIAQKVEKSETGAPVENWKGTIANARGETIREFDFGAFPPEKFVWDGYDAQNQLAENGDYSYTISATDKAGNSAQQKIAFKLDTVPTELSIALNKTAFNPNRPAEIRILPKASTDIVSYSLSICDADTGKEVWADSRKGDSRIQLPVVNWDGKANTGDENGMQCKDGTYIALLDTVSASGNEAHAKSQKFVIDTVPPAIELNVPYSVFSPATDSKKTAVPVSAKSSAEESWTARVYNDKNESVRTYTWKGSVESFSFDGRDASGNLLADGTYSIAFSSEDAAGNKATETIPNIVIDNRETKSYVTAESDAFSPNGNGYLDTQKFTIRNSLNEGIESWKFTVETTEGTVAKTWSDKTDGKIPQSIVWDGKGDDGNIIADNAYIGKLSIVYEKGNVIDTATGVFISCVTPPKLSVKTKPKYFSPDNDGEDDDLFINLKRENEIVPIKDWSLKIYAPDPKDPEKKGPLFWTTGGKSSLAEQIIWDGRSNSGELVQSAMDYPYAFTVTDTLGMTSTVEGKIEIDILVVKVGNRLKMAVPSIIFRSDAADFGVRVVDASGKVVKSGITPAQAATNERVLKRIAEILNKFKSYEVTIEGHANSQSGTRIEEEQDTTQYGPGLLKLSKQRAEFVKSQLKSYGVKGDRLNTAGKGGTEPIVNRTDSENNWKNRRVEFILDKKK